MTSPTTMAPEVSAPEPIVPPGPVLVAGDGVFARRVLEVLPHLDPRLGGMSTVVPRLADELIKSCGREVSLAIFDGGADGDSERSTTEPAGLLEQTRWPASRMGWLRDATLRQRFQASLAEADAVHIHGLWETSSTAAARLARASRTPYVISAHGMLEPWALANKPLKKRVYAALLERGNLTHAACLHALTADEAEDYRRFGCRTQPIAIIPNGVDAPDPGTFSPAAFLERFPALAGKTILLFLGRIHFKKGLDLLIGAWAELAARFPQAMLVLAGPDSESSRAAVEGLIAQHGLADRVLFTGMLDAAMKWSALAAASCFVLPSYSEGLSVALLEALSLGVPVVCTAQCHLPEVERAGAGLVVQTDKRSVEGALAHMLAASPRAAQNFRACGLALAQAYRWRTVAAQMAEMYDWIAGGPPPVRFIVREAGA